MRGRLSPSRPARRFIGVELASEGGLIEQQGKLYCFGQVSPRTRKPKKEAFDCGRAYKVQRKQEGSPWEDIGISTDAEELCSNQPRGVEWHYRVVAVNKAGTGQPSATVTVVL